MIQQDLLEYAFFGDYDKKIQLLADMSPEQWSFQGQSDNGILKNY